MLARDPRIAWADVRAVMQLTPELAADMAEASLVVLIDASAESPPGSVAVRRLTRFPGQGAGVGVAVSIGTRGGGATSHHVGADELLALARELYGAAPDAFVVSVGVGDMEVGEELSPAVAAALPAVGDAVAALLAGRPGPAG